MKMTFLIGLSLVLIGCSQTLPTEVEDESKIVQIIEEPLLEVTSEKEPVIELRITEDPLKQIDLISETLEGLPEL